MNTLRKPAKANAFNIFHVETDAGDLEYVALEWLSADGDIDAIGKPIRIRTATQVDTVKRLMMEATDQDGGYEAPASTCDIMWLPKGTVVKYDLYCLGN